MRLLSALGLLLFGVCACRANVATGPRSDVSPEAEETRKGQAVRAVAVGDTAPRFVLRDLDGARATIVPGKVNLVFMPQLQAVFARQGSRGMALLGISVDDEAPPPNLAEFARTHGGRFSIAHDLQHRVANIYKPAAEPTYYLIDRAGVVRFIYPGFHDGQTEVMERDVETLLNERR